MIWKMWIASAAAMVVRAVPEAMNGSPQKNFVAETAINMPMTAAPIDPSWIISGTPVARISEHSRGADEQALTALWDCTAGEFRWFFHWDETVMILEGEVHIVTADGIEKVLKAGDVAYFAGGTWATWRIDNYLKKIAFLRKPFPKPMAFAYRLRNLLRSGGLTGLSA